MGLFSFLRKKSSLDKVREELQILNKKLSTSMSFLEVEEEIQFLKEMELGPSKDYSLREKHFKNVVTFWFKGLLAEHEILVIKKVIKPFGKDETVKAYLNFVNCLRGYLVNEGLLKDKKNNSGGIQTTLEDLYMKTFKSYEVEEEKKDEKEDDKKDKKKGLKKSKDEKEEILNNDDKALKDLREKGLKEKESSKEISDSKELGESKEISSDSKTLNSGESKGLGAKEVEGPKTPIADKAQKVALGINNKEHSNAGKTLDNDSSEPKKEETIQGRNAYNVLTERLNQIQGERAELETQKMKMENFMEKNKDFMKELKEWKRENDKLFAEENRKNLSKELGEKNKLEGNKDLTNKKGPKETLKDPKAAVKSEKEPNNFFERAKKSVKEGMERHNKAINKLLNREPQKPKEEIFKMEDNFGSEYREKLEQVRQAQIAEKEYERNREAAFKAMGLEMPEKKNVEIKLDDDVQRTPVIENRDNKQYEPPVIENRTLNK